VKFCTHVGLLSGQVFSPFGEGWLSGSHGGGGISRRPGVDRRMLLVVMDEQAGVESAVRAVVIWLRRSAGIGNNNLWFMMSMNLMLW